MKCPSCGVDGARLLVSLNPGVVLECPGCGEVWRDGEDLRLVKFQVLYGLAVERIDHWGE